MSMGGGSSRAGSNNNNSGTMATINSESGRLGTPSKGQGTSSSSLGQSPPPIGLTSKPLFKAGEKVLCYEPDVKKAQVLYDSKVLEVVRKEEPGGAGFYYYEYKIHFQGWKDTWDRYVTENNVLKDTNENRDLQRRLREKVDIDKAFLKKLKSRRKTIQEKLQAAQAEGYSFDTSEGLEGGAGGEDNLDMMMTMGGSSSSKPRVQSTSKLRGQLMAGGEHQLMDELMPDDGDEEEDLEEEEDDEEEEDEDSEPDGDEDQGSRQIVIPEELKKLLEVDFLLVTLKNRVVRLPTKFPVALLLEEYFHHVSRELIKSFAGKLNKALPQTPTSASSYSLRHHHHPLQQLDPKIGEMLQEELTQLLGRVELIRAVVEDVRVMFDAVLSQILLYYGGEVGQYEGYLRGEFATLPGNGLKKSCKENDGHSKVEKNNTKLDAALTHPVKREPQELQDGQKSDSRSLENVVALMQNESASAGSMKRDSATATMDKPSDLVGIMEKSSKTPAPASTIIDGTSPATALLPCKRRKIIADEESTNSSKATLGVVVAEPGATDDVGGGTFRGRANTGGGKGRPVSGPHCCELLEKCPFPELCMELNEFMDQLQEFKLLPKQEAASPFDPRPADTYGLHHLLRLFVKMPDILSRTSIPRRKIGAIVDEMNHMLIYFANLKSAIVDVKSDYYTPLPSSSARKERTSFSQHSHNTLGKPINVLQSPEDTLQEGLSMCVISGQNRIETSDMDCIPMATTPPPQEPKTNESTASSPTSKSPTNKKPSSYSLRQRASFKF